MKSENYTHIPPHAHTEGWLKLKGENRVLLSMQYGEVELSYTVGQV